MLDVELKEAWRRADPVLEADAKAYWEANGLVAAGERERRAGELCTVAYVDGRAVAVSTATIRELPHLKAQFAMYRCSVAADFRRHALAEQVTAFTRERLEAWSLAHPEAKVAGMAAIIQAAELAFRGREPLWPDSGIDLTLVGYTPSGDQVRVAWFRHTRVGDPLE